MALAAEVRGFDDFGLSEGVSVRGMFDDFARDALEEGFFFVVVLDTEVEDFLRVKLEGDSLRALVADFLALRVESPSIDLFGFIIYNYNMKSQKLTKKQLALLNFLEDFTEEKGLSPSYREIQAGLGLSSVSAVAEHIDNLVAKGVLKKVPGAARTLEILDYKHEDTVNFFKAKLIDCTDEEKEILLKAAEILDIEVE